MNREYSREIICNLLEWGVEEFYVCAGARDIPLIETVCNIKSNHKIVFNHFEERSAAFYALGRIKSLKKPVAIITTSGTAVGELLPAVMEAYYSNLPLILITADRPKSYRSTGSPQSAEQKDIFGVYVSACFDLSPGQLFDLSNIPKNKPIHFNICFDIPLQSGELKEIPFIENKKNINLQEINSKLFEHNKNKLESFISKSKNLLVIISQLNENNYTGIIEFTENLNAPVYLESISNIRESQELAHLRINCADKIWAHSIKSDFKIDSILKIGGTPTHRIWRDLDETYKNIKVLSISNSNFPGMPNTESINTPVELFLSNIKIRKYSIDDSKINQFLSLDKKCYLKLNELFEFYPEAEESIFYHLSKIIEINSRVYLGNSLPIRNWDLSASYDYKNFKIDASRGLNGIDGQISSFLGFADEFSSENWGIFGDLTTLYDMAGLWMLSQRPNLITNIVVINNKGGKIFNKVLKGEASTLCQNNHDFDFKYLAKFWRLSYELHKNSKNIQTSKKTRIIEVQPDPFQTDLFSKHYSEI